MSKRRLKKISDFEYVIWFEDEGKGSITSPHGGIMIYYSKRAFEEAKNFARNFNKNVLIQNGRSLRKATPQGIITQLQEGADYEIIE